ncbi:MAG: fasciclin domain-containing protein [Prevotella sp.]|nr:fasciclin domain-containing protein [Prevotella sp.]
MKRKTIVTKKRRWAARTACGLLVCATMLALPSCEDEVLTGQPSWLGNSIYERLEEEGNYSTVLRLIDDLGQREVLAHTGSKTLFAADDDAYKKWFAGNSWGVSSYEQLTTAQKKLLLNNSMINNAYLIELMSNVSGTPPMEGMAMRRETATSIYDSVYVMPIDKMPKTSAWDGLRAKGKPVPIFKDATTAPMIHFLPAYMTFNNITSEDLSILTNGQATSINEAWVNGKKVVSRDITCKNGYVQKVDGVIESSPNMAEILRQHPIMSRWSELVDRFSAPYPSDALRTEYNRIYNNEDSVFVMRYFSRRSYNPNTKTVGANNTLPDMITPVTELLSFDPGWNHYMYSNTMGYDLHYDAAAMLVPTNKALEDWWNDQGRDLKDEYEEWDSIPNKILSKLINVNMLPTFSESVPSKFGHVLNDAKEPLGITKEDVDSCFMGCNGVVYLTNKVFTPAEYASVTYPALAHESTMSVIYWVIEQQNFLPYLLSMDSQYALLLPTNEAMTWYIDPSSYWLTTNQTDTLGNTTRVEWPRNLYFYKDLTKREESEQVQAWRYLSTIDENGNIERGILGQTTNVDREIVDKFLTDLMDQLIIVIPDKSKTLEDYVRDGYSLFKTKGGTLLRVTMGDNGNLAFEGAWQMEHNNHKIETTEVFQKTNGRSYVIDSQVPLGSRKSLYQTLAEHEEYSGFLSLMQSSYCDLFTQTLNSTYKPSGTNNYNMRLFDNYNYTVFVPTNDSIAKLQEQGIFPSADELLDTKGFEKLDTICQEMGWYPPGGGTAREKKEIKDKVKACITEIITNFVRYHVMDHSVAIGMAPEVNSTTSYESMKRNPETGRFYKLEVEFGNQGITIKDVVNEKTGLKKKVINNPGLYNNICREYWFEELDNNRGTRLFMGSDAVVHLIDAPLYYENPRPWKEVVAEYLQNN